jgi:surface antigen
MGFSNRADIYYWFQGILKSASGKNPLRFRLLIPLCSAILAVSGCTTLDTSGTTRISAPLRDGVLAGDIGTGLSERARKKAAEAEYKALEGGRAGVPVAWRLNETLQGSVVPEQPYSVGAANCRRYTHSISQDGEVRSATGTACRREDGVWRPLS